MKLVTRKSRGFSLAEVLIAILVVAIGLAGVTSALVYGIQNSKRGKEVSESSQLARTFFEYMQQTSVIDTAGITAPDGWPDSESGINDGPQARRLLNEAPFGAVSFVPERVSRYKRNISLERLSDDPSSHRYKLARVTVRVYWEDDSGDHNSKVTGVIEYERP